MLNILNAYQELFIIALILIVNAGLKLIFLRHIKKLEVKDLLKLIINWVSAFFIVGLLFVYFSEAKWLFQPLFTLNQTSISLFMVGLSLLIIILAFKIVAIIMKYILPRAYSKYDISIGAQFTFNRLFQYVTVTIAVLIALNTIGINLSSLTVFAGVIGVGIGFGMQNIASNFISGLIILFERPIQVGDRVIVDDIVGDIDEIKMRATVVRTLDNERIIIPNSFFLEEKFINRSYTDTRLRLMIPVGVSYGSDVRHVEKLLLDAVAKIHESWQHTILISESRVHFIGFGDSSLDFKLYVWINKPAMEYQIKSDLHFMILEKFRENNIEIPFPQRDVHLKQT